jgi:hypothetical protein
LIVSFIAGSSAFEPNFEAVAEKNMQTQPDDRFDVFESSTHRSQRCKEGLFLAVSDARRIAKLLSIKIARQKVFQLIAPSLVLHSSM